MSFGGFFGGSSSSSSQSSSTPTTNPPSPPPSSNSSSTIKQTLLSEIQTQSSLGNARALISKLNEICFASCILAPAGTLSAKEQSCLSGCMEKYIEAWNAVNKTYVGRLQREGVGAQAGQSGEGGVVGGGERALGGGSGGREMF